MTMSGLISLGSKWSDVRPKLFYVYSHRRRSDGSVFYVGKGSKHRAWDINSRNAIWKRIAIKHGAYVHIEKDGMSDACAVSLEKILISKYRSFGRTMSNMSDGGEGQIGYTSPLRRTIYTSEGEVFKSLRHAEEFLINNGFPTASRGNISSCLNGKQGFAYGRKWSRTSSPERPEITTQKEAAARNFSESLSIRVSSVVYGEFKSIMSAVRYLQSIGYPLARSSNISQVCKGRRRIAYGSTWEYT